MRTWESYTLTDLPNVASEVILALQDAPQVWLFRGQMGAGKTTLTKEIVKQLGVDESVQSPTFSLVNEYLNKKGQRIYHFDLYRLKNVQEALAIGIEEYLDSGNYCIIEWPEQAEALWDFPHVNFQLEAINENERNLTLIW
ncbi:tRNA (adenosine(37)-N6)-threonylcarbamoyltransferase complex ATPase subunit type 1 TsaE [Aquirufa sp.]|jgi:tRNA threonylcarbamoyladenosine biosynthesis protein TsaE|uniref:tRNA (adenosine(37)-N6)-threonylcarbamoyltransferase complex ATPase subunit type 1 TsaE n=1 Tax=Aquirufa sp. TaxID=2676249 RepID=UPI0037C00110